MTSAWRCSRLSCNEIKEVQEVQEVQVQEEHGEEEEEVEKEGGTFCLKNCHRCLRAIVRVVSSTVSSRC
jgi:hypothetical protein